MRLAWPKARARLREGGDDPPLSLGWMEIVPDLLFALVLTRLWQGAGPTAWTAAGLLPLWHTWLGLAHHEAQVAHPSRQARLLSWPVALAIAFGATGPALWVVAAARLWLAGLWMTVEGGGRTRQQALWLVVTGLCWAATAASPAPWSWLMFASAAVLDLLVPWVVVERVETGRLAGDRRIHDRLALLVALVLGLGVFAAASSADSLAALAAMVAAGWLYFDEVRGGRDRRSPALAWAAVQSHPVLLLGMCWLAWWPGAGLALVGAGLAGLDVATDGVGDRFERARVASRLVAVGLGLGLLASGLTYASVASLGVLLALVAFDAALAEA